MQPTVDHGIDTLMDSAIRGSGLATIMVAISAPTLRGEARDLIEGAPT